ncbi:hypothetical protein HPB47_017212 [Ixodes persulcatus]|uniref:Uncharacterized protein n=1 Tax=Ixodes persulcatus TaxID=34615 RepID=A0AC60QSK3_IXOPE|nr:hypothetical protein HPB47_017212 [Ixodes persulcatus]
MPVGSTTPQMHRVCSFHGMVVVVVDRTDITPEQLTKEAGWLDSYRNRNPRTIAEHAGAGVVRTRYSFQKPQLPRQLQLPREDIKIIVRPRDRLNISKLSDALSRDGAEDDIYRSSYATPPADTSTCGIHNILDYDTGEDITKILINKNPPPPILQVRPMGNTNSVIIIFEGSKVTFYVYYRGAEYRYNLHKKKVEVCGACGRIGPRADVCPTPDKQHCGTQNPTDNHNCNPSCALCGKDHPTGDKRCRKRFQTPFFIKQHQWEKRRQQQQTLHNCTRRRQRPIAIKSRRQKDSGGPTSLPIPIKEHGRQPCSLIRRTRNRSATLQVDLQLLNQPGDFRCYGTRKNYPF